MSHKTQKQRKTANDPWLCLHSRPLVITTLSFSGVSQSRSCYVSFRHDIRFGINNKPRVFSACQQRNGAPSDAIWFATAKKRRANGLKFLFVTSTEVKYAPPPSRFLYMLLQKVAFSTIHTVLAPITSCTTIIYVFHMFYFLIQND